MELILVIVDTNKIRLVGRWRINVMLRYLHTYTHNFAAGPAMNTVHHGYYVLILTSHEG